MRDKKVVPFCPKPVPLKDLTQREIIEVRRAKRKEILEKTKRKDR
ncbi:hypothetical protein [Paenibacillus peoriae]|nr:hypothetical protein [Paenibacillus peoriae]